MLNSLKQAGKDICREINRAWEGLLAGEVEETPTDIVVRVEAPGMNKDDCRINIEGNLLHLSGEKHLPCP